jgi:hypothetical protein
MKQYRAGAVKVSTPQLGRNDMTTENKISRLAGLVYLIVVLTGIFSLVYVPSRISVSSDPQSTLANIVASESLFRYGVASFLIKQVGFLLLPLVLFRLLRPVNHDVAILMVALAVVSVPIALVSLVNRLDALSLLTDAYYTATYSAEHLQAAAMQSLEAYGNGLLVTKLFWGLWLLPFGYLVLRSGFLPKVLGLFLMLGCLGYVIDVFGELLVSGYSSTSVPDYVLLPAAVGEIGTCLWLLLVGARQPKSVPA